MGGTLCFAFAGPRPFHDDERALLSVLAQHTAQALVRTRLFQAEQAARAAAEAEQRRDRFLADATAALASALDPDRTLRDVARLAVPTFADLAAVLLRGPGGELDKIVVHHDPSREALVHELYARFPPPPDAATGVAYVLRTGEPELYPEITDAMKARSVPDPDQRRLIDAIGLCSMIAVPMRIGGQVIGALTFWHGASGRRFDRADLDVARALADRAALAIEHTRAVRALEHAVRAREDLLAIVSHDLRNPLGVVMLKTQVLLDQLPADAEKPRRHVQQLHQAAQRMEALVRDLMDLAAIDAGLLRVDLRPEDVGELLAQVIDLHAPLAAKAGLTLAAAPPPEPHVVLCDRERVLQVFSNLIGNAIKHTPAGGTIRMTARADRHRVWFAVRDTGPGIAPEHLNDAFRRHWKGEARDRSSLGLGLYIAKGLVDALGGEIGVDSTLGVGTTFRFSLRSALPE